MKTLEKMLIDRAEAQFNERYSRVFSKVEQALEGLTAELGGFRGVKRLLGESETAKTIDAFLALKEQSETNDLYVMARDMHGERFMRQTADRIAEGR